MCDTRAEVNLGFCRDRFNEGTHMCLVFRDETHRRKIVSKFVESGLLDDERVFYFADTAELSDVAAWLAALEVDVEPFLSGGSFTVDSAVSTYCPDGSFLPDRMYGTVKEAYNSSCASGYGRSRVTGEMSWALRGLPGSERLMEYESGINEVLKTHPITAMCQYDAGKFSGELIFQALQVHPYMVMDGQLVHNPYYL